MFLRFKPFRSGFEIRTYVRPEHRDVNGQEGSSPCCRSPGKIKSETKRAEGKIYYLEFSLLIYRKIVISAWRCHKQRWLQILHMNPEKDRGREMRNGKISNKPRQLSSFSSYSMYGFLIVNASDPEPKCQIVPSEGTRQPPVWCCVSG